jgi:hypothetical protein
MIATLPLVQWALTKMRQPPVSRSRLHDEDHYSIVTSQEQGQLQAEEEGEQGVAAAVGVLVVLVAGFIVYFSALTAAFFHTTVDTLVPALVIIVTGFCLHLGMFVKPNFSDHALPVWALSKLVVLVIAASRFSRPLAAALQQLGVPYNSKHGEPLPPINAAAMGTAMVYDVGLVLLYVFWMRRHGEGDQNKVE